MFKKYIVGISLLALMFSGLSAAEKNATSSSKESAPKKVEQKEEAAKEDKKVKKEETTKSATSEKKEKKIEEGALEAAKKLLEEMGLKKVYENAVNNSTKRLVNANPAFEKIKDKIKAFYEKNIGWDVMKEDLAKLYAKYFSKKELEDITAFYKTPTGKKVLSKMGQLTYEGQMLTRKRLEPHLNELKKLLDDAAAKENKQKPKQAKK